MKHIGFRSNIRIIKRLTLLLTRKGYLVAEQGMTYLADTDPDAVLGSLQAVRITDSRQDSMPEAFQQRFPINAFVPRDSAKNAVQGADTECDVVRYGEALMPGFFG